jgi:two-component system alkaline phosphatase synthesis response regulator PhoP
LQKILLVEDEESLMTVLSMNLKIEGYEIVQAIAGNEVLQYDYSTFGLIILDVMLPEINGFDLCEIIRKTSKTPILFISAKGTSLDRIKGLKIGANDYLVKPFHLEEFLLRVKNLVSLSSPSNSVELQSYNFGNNFSINFLTYEVESNIGKSTFSMREIEMLRLLIEKIGQVVSREEILNKLWAENSSPNSRTIDNYILNFRKHFESDVKNPRHFHSLRGVGYKFLD